jgi:hypothetical protein
MADGKSIDPKDMPKDTDESSAMRRAAAPKRIGDRE